MVLSLRKTCLYRNRHNNNKVYIVTGEFVQVHLLQLYSVYDWIGGFSRILGKFWLGCQQNNWLIGKGCSALNSWYIRESSLYFLQIVPNYYSNSAYLNTLCSTLLLVVNLSLNQLPPSVIPSPYPLDSFSTPLYKDSHTPQTKQSKPSETNICQMSLRFG